MKNRFLILTSLFVSLLSSTVLAAVPSGYYNSCEGKSGQDLLKALYSTISSHTNVGYDGLWTVYKKSDVRADGSLWDIYTTKNWGSNFTRCGNYSVIGDCVNREHSFPKSWWKGYDGDQYSDAFHLYPTDGKVNGQRSNFPYGECANGSRLPNNGSVQALGKLGASTFSGYSGTVFEPDDQYKGDLARSYFYLAACYNNVISFWNQGNGSAMLAGNNYPVFKTWAVNLLLKWSRQDEVSQKELDRNDAIYSHQKNRNPFIDHPELVEHIWGDKQSEPWFVGGAVTPEITHPVQNTVIDMGYAAVEVTRSVKVLVKGNNIAETTYISTSGAGFSVNPYTLTAAQVNAGTEVTVSVNSSTAGDAEGTLSIVSGDAIREVDIVAVIEDGLPIYDATNVSSDEFTLGWVSLGDATNYTLHVKLGEEYVNGYPKQVVAGNETFTVNGLEPLTAYKYWLTSGSLTSRICSVTTADLMPSILVMFDGTLEFFTKPGEPSEVAELLLDVENVSEDIVIAVDSPFEVSTDKSSWGASVTLAAEEDRFYLRLNGTAEGDFETTIEITAGSYVVDDASAKGTIKATEAFLEDWEFADAASYNTYTAKTFTTNVCTWHTDNGGFWPENDNGYVSTTAIRMGKNSTSTLTMMENKVGGIGVVTFEVLSYGTDGSTTVVVEYSGDEGSTWQEMGTISFGGTTISSQSVTVNKSGEGRLRFRQTSGKRWFIDNIAIGDYSTLALEGLEYHSWDAYSRGGKLVVECHDATTHVCVYGVDGLTWINETFTMGEHEIDLPKGLYLVVSNDFVRRVLVK